ncbi:MAG: cobalt-precorrin 5A hydrolase [Deltaproteobacteria bacterium]|nr:cobalt-precorrin 5A hydrolase [Deltaproteobacteria bacterium]
MKKGKTHVLSLFILPVTNAGHRLGLKIAKGFPNTRLYTPAELKDGGLKRAAKEAWRRRTPIVFISASGIAVRTIAPFIKDKASDPAVVFIDEAGRFVVSLLSGHLGGANSLAKEIARLTGATPVVSTATDLKGLPCIEDIAREFSFAIEDTSGIKRVNSEILKGGRVTVVDGDTQRLSALKAAFKDGPFAFRKTVRKGNNGVIALVTASTNIPPAISLVLRPRELALGIGCGRGVGRKEIKEAVDKAFKEAGLSMASIAKVATIDIKRGERGLTGYARSSGLEIEFLSAKDLEKRMRGLKPSRFVLGTIGAGGVAEPSALISSGGKTLCIRKKKTGRVTVAASRVPFRS